MRRLPSVGALRRLDAAQRDALRRIEGAIPRPDPGMWQAACRGLPRPIFVVTPPKPTPPEDPVPTQCDAALRKLVAANLPYQALEYIIRAVRKPYPLSKEWRDSAAFLEPGQGYPTFHTKASRRRLTKWLSSLAVEIGGDEPTKQQQEFLVALMADMR